MSEAFEEGADAFYFGRPMHESPYNWTDGHDMHPQEYFDWALGWLAAEEEEDASQTT